MIWNFCVHWDFHWGLKLGSLVGLESIKNWDWKNSSFRNSSMYLCDYNYKLSPSSIVKSLKHASSCIVWALTKFIKSYLWLPWNGHVLLIHKGHCGPLVSDEWQGILLCRTEMQLFILKIRGRKWRYFIVLWLQMNSFGFFYNKDSQGFKNDDFHRNPHIVLGLRTIPTNLGNFEAKFQQRMHNSWGWFCHVVADYAIGMTWECREQLLTPVNVP